ncbi:MAG TPA: aspartyl protease family protein, partial [Candidatus Tripitaka californicus]|uniref:aspartyl protease family protein n=1 Tax=Candidatus Tripitaka californicus TaxID=3367616 RepID=UPI00402650D3
MGTFHVNIAVSDPLGKQWESVNALVDTGATYTWVPRSLLERLGVIPASRFP